MNSMARLIILFFSLLFSSVAQSSDVAGTVSTALSSVSSAGLGIFTNHPILTLVFAGGVGLYKYFGFGLGAKIDGLRAEMVTKFKKLKTFVAGQFTNLTEEVQAVQNDVKQVGKQVGNVQKDTKNINEGLAKAQESQQKNTEQLTSVVNTSATTTQKDIGALKEEVNKANTSIAAMKQLVSNTDNRTNNIDGKVGSLQSTFAATQKVVNDIEKKLDDHTKNTSTVHENMLGKLDIQSLATKDIKAEINSLSTAYAASAKIPTEAIEKLTADIKGVDDKLIKLQTDYAASATTQAEDIKKLTADIKKLTADIKGVDDTLIKLQQGISDVQTTLAKVHTHTSSTHKTIKQEYGPEAQKSKLRLKELNMPTIPNTKKNKITNGKKNDPKPIVLEVTEVNQKSVITVIKPMITAEVTQQVENLNSSILADNASTNNTNNTDIFSGINVERIVMAAVNQAVQKLLPTMVEHCVTACVNKLVSHQPQQDQLKKRFHAITGKKESSESSELKSIKDMLSAQKKLFVTQEKKFDRAISFFSRQWERVHQENHIIRQKAGQLVNTMMHLTDDSFTLLKYCGPLMRQIGIINPGSRRALCEKKATEQFKVSSKTTQAIEYKNKDEYAATFFALGMGVASRMLCCIAGTSPLQQITGS